MFEALENGIGLDIVMRLQAAGNPLCDALAKILHVVGGDIGYLLILPLIYWCISRKLGRQLMYVLLIALLGHLLVKEVFARPRPFILHPEAVIPLVSEDGFSFPSGHVTLSVTIWGFVAYHVRRRWVWAAVIVYMLTLGWSRMYAGMHYPEDVIGGMLLASALLWFSLKTVNSAARLWNRTPVWQRVVLMMVVGLAAGLLFHRDDNGLSTSGIILGAGIGLVVEERAVGFSAEGSRRQRILRGVVGMLLVMTVFFGLRAAFDSLTPPEVWRVFRYGVVTFGLIFIWPWLSVPIGLTQAVYPARQPQLGNQQTPVRDS